MRVNYLPISSPSVKHVGYGVIVHQHRVTVLEIGYNIASPAQDYYIRTDDLIVLV